MMARAGFSATRGGPVRPRTEHAGMSRAGTASETYAAGDTVALFVPCFIDVLYPSVGKAVVSVFERLGVAIDYPAEQTCCGQPAFNGGHTKEALALARRFAGVFGDHKWIVVPSGSCGAMTKRFYPMLEPDGAASAVGARVFDLATFLVDVLGVTDVGARFPHSVTMLDGCHGRRELGCTDAARRLLKAVGEIDYRELPAIEECCGFGGLFSVKYDVLSTSMGSAKVAHAASTGAEYLVSGDSSCLMHVGGMLEHRGSSLKTLHLAEVLASR
jgi:L-lactate dehydrogenase complex protein LldE